jgi:two-component system cell cycle response regulator DivK
VKGRILLVEDDALSLKLMRDVLVANGYETDEATTGDAALEKVSRFHPDLIVMDIGLPGMDGVEATRQLKSGRSTSQLPVVAVTAYAMPGDEERMRGAGCDAYLTKPLQFSEFLRVVGDLLPASAQVSPATGSEK